MAIIEAPSAERRARILDGAARVFARDGYDGASMSHIAAETGMSKGTLYNYFPGKAALFSAYVARMCDDQLSRVFAAEALVGPPVEVLRYIAQTMIELILSPLAVQVYRVMISEALRFPELVEGFFAAGPARALRTMAIWLAEQTALGNLAVDDPQFAAEQFFALCQTRLSMRTRLNLIPTPSPGDIAPVVDGAIATFLARYGKG